VRDYFARRGFRVKLPKPETVIVVAALMLLCFAGGYFFCRATVASGNITVLTERAAPAQELALTAPETEEREPAAEEQAAEEREPAAEEQTAEPEGGVPSPDAPLDLNTAGVDELTALPGIGPTIAGRIVAYRDETGPFTSVEELTDVEGIGEKKLEDIRDLVFAGG